MDKLPPTLNPHVDELIAQYDEWVYPKPLADLTAYVAAGGHDLSDPSRVRRKLWPRAIEPKDLDILVAGCGANQAAIIAHANPQHRVVGVDLSPSAIAHHQHLLNRHKLKNLTLNLMAVEDVAALGRKFDYIVATGVLHHLQGPEAGLGALRDVLHPHGVMSLMVYGQYRRAGVYMVQEALRLMDVPRSAEGVAFARDTASKLPPWHHARSYLDAAPDLAYDAGFVDTLLNARDRAYTVPEVLALVRDCALTFQSWLDGVYYSPAAVFSSGAKIHERVHDLPIDQQWHVADLLGQMTATHRFLVCHPARHLADTAFAQSVEWLDRVPYRNPDLAVSDAGAGAGNLKRAFNNLQLSGKLYAAFKRIDGKRTFRALLSGITDAGERELAQAIFEQMIEWDHLYCEIPCRA